jgi:hypothetical protein
MPSASEHGEPPGGQTESPPVPCHVFRRCGTVFLSVEIAARGVSQSRQGSRRTLSGRWLQCRWLQWPQAASKWRLEPFAPLDTALWAYSGCSLRYGLLGYLQNRHLRQRRVGLHGRGTETEPAARRFHCLASPLGMASTQSWRLDASIPTYGSVPSVVIRQLFVGSSKRPV